MADVEEREKEKTETELLTELTELLGRKPSELSGIWSVAKETGYCLHCSRVLLVPFLSLTTLCGIRTSSAAAKASAKQKATQRLRKSRRR